MKQIDEPRLEQDLHYRYQYLAEFIGFVDSDAAAIQSLHGLLSPQIPSIVEASYERLLAYDASARHFLPRQHGYDGPLPTGVESLRQSSEQVQFRKEHLRRYLMSIFSNDYDSKMVKYLDIVGKIHTPKAGNKRIDVPLVQMNAMMGFLADILTKVILELSLARDVEAKTLRAIHKLLWIQNDLINRHYAEAGSESRTEAELAPKADEAPANARSAWR